MAHPTAPFRLLATLAVSAALLAGCLGTSDTDDAVIDDAPDVPVEPFDPTVYSFEGNASRVGIICFTDGSGSFEEDVAGWDLVFEADRDGAYVVWQDSNGENHGTAEQGAGRVPAGATSFYVCTDMFDPVMEATYTLTITEPLPEGMESEDGADDGAED